MPIYKRGEKWYAHVRYKGRQLKRVVEEGGRAEAKILEAELLQRLRDAGRRVYYLDDALGKWLDNHASQLRAYKKYAEHAKQLVPYVHGRYLVDAPSVAAEYIKVARAVPLQPATINQRIRILRRVCNVAFAEWGWLETPLGKRIKTLREERRRVYLTADEVEAVAQAVFSPAVGDVVRFAAYTGLRLSELLSLTARSVRDAAVFLTPRTKSGLPRTVPLPKRLDGIRPPFSVTRFQLQDQFRTATRKLGMVGYRFHDLRHTYASLLLQRGATLSEVCELMGHSTITITKDLYGHLEHRHLRAATALLDEI